MSAPTLDESPAGPPPAPEKTAARPERGIRSRPSGPGAARPAPRPVLAAVGAAVTLLGVLAFGFAVYVPAFSGIQEAHSQAAFYRTLRHQLEEGVAPIGPTAYGAPVAAVDIPAIGLHNAVVVEGTTSRDLMRGPGHRSDTPLPGQQGVSVLYGRRVTYGGPFGRLPALRAGDRITVTTGQGRATYTVNAFGDGSHPIADTVHPDRLVLVTADSGWAPDRYLLVGATLDGRPQPDPGGRYGYRDAEHPLAHDQDALAPLQLWALGLCAAAALATFAVLRWHRWTGLLCSLPVLVALTWCVYENAAALLPNLG
ncbi:class E sortase [Peterkaempfera sp. SMS 1(5)a]|uniref:class E sortase n=1 Tax=Peterkaempfera podocarpi TaxID=3232308 RepID=UPI00366B120D